MVVRLLHSDLKCRNMECLSCDTRRNRFDQRWRALPLLSLPRAPPAGRSATLGQRGRCASASGRARLCRSQGMPTLRSAPQTGPRGRVGTVRHSKGPAATSIGYGPFVPLLHGAPRDALDGLYALVCRCGHDDCLPEQSRCQYRIGDFAPCTNGCLSPSVLDAFACTQDCD